MHTPSIGRFYSVHELRDFCQTLNQDFLGAQVQEIVVTDRFIGIGLWRGEPLYLLFCLDLQKPWPLIFKNKKTLKSQKPKPISLFMNAHLKNKILKKIHLKEELGRVLELEFESHGEVTQLEAQLIPRQFNLLVRALTQKKSISYVKPQELMPAKNEGEIPYIENLNFYEQSDLIWQQLFSAQAKTPGGSDNSLSIEKILAKKQKALKELLLQLQNNEASLFYEYGEKIKSLSSENFSRQQMEWPEIIRKIIDPKKPLAWNMEQCFGKAKKIEQKKSGTLDRVEILKKEIAKLESGHAVLPVKSNTSRMMEKAEVSGRKLIIDEQMEAVCGKSAEDNLKLLRKAQAWDLWIHLKDYPSSHAIIRRPKNKEITPTQIEKVVQWFLKEKPVKSLLPGSKVEVVYVECRFVRPIKGDKLGRVTYHNPRTLSVILPP